VSIVGTSFYLTFFSMYVSGNDITSKKTVFNRIVGHCSKGGTAVTDFFAEQVAKRLMGWRVLSVRGDGHDRFGSRSGCHATGMLRRYTQREEVRDEGYGVGWVVAPIMEFS